MKGSIQDKTNFISLYLDQTGQVWAGTYGEGLYRINPSDLSYKRFTKNNGLGDNNVISISGRDNFIWFSTLGGGVTRFNTENSQLLNFEHPDLEGSYIYQTRSDKKGKTWIAGSLKFPSYIYNERFYPVTITGQRVPQFYSVALDTSGIPWFNTGDKGILRVEGDSIR